MMPQRTKFALKMINGPQMINGLRDAPFVTAQCEVYYHLREQILSGELKAGSRLNPAEIGSSLGVSRMPVREALRQLDSEGLVTIRPNRGVVVMNLSIAEIQETFLIRTALEVLAARESLPHLTPRAIQGLANRLQLMSEAQEDAQLWVRHHEEFHDALCAMSGLPRLCADIKRCRALVSAYLTRHFMRFNLIPEMEGHGHAAIIAALRTYNMVVIEACIRDHVMAASEAVIQCARVKSHAIGEMADAS